MKELSLNILDITENSVKAGASLTEIYIIETEKTLTLIIKDNGCGMSPHILEQVSNPFYTTRKTRKVGMGIPLLKMAAEQTGGSFKITSVVDDGTCADHGTEVCAVFMKEHLDFTPLGDVISTVVTLVQGHPDTDFLFRHSLGEVTVELDTREIKKVLEDIPINSFEILSWIEDNLREQYLVF